MHVLLDARTILSPKTGDRTYWLGLCRALPAVCPEDQFTLALDAPPPAGLVPEAPNLRWVARPARNGRLWTALVLPRLARTLGVDLVHLQYVAPPWLGRPFVTTVHDCSFALFPEHFTRRDGTWLRTLVPHTARRAAGVIAVSETTRGDLLRLYRLPSARVHVVSEGVEARWRPAGPAEVERVRGRFGLPSEYLLSVGVLQPRKNIVGLLHAYAIARGAHGVTAPLVVAGKTGWLAGPITAAVAELGLGDSVRFVGYVADEDLPALYSGAALTLYPSFYEGFGLPPLESLACGAPVVVSNAPALLETVGGCAPALAPDDHAGWAATMAGLLAAPDERARLAAVGAARAREYTWERAARQHVAVYRAALAAKELSGNKSRR